MRVQRIWARQKIRSEREMRGKRAPIGEKIKRIFLGQKNSKMFDLEKIIFIQFSMKIFDQKFSDFFISKFSAGRFQNALKTFPVKLFGQTFFKSALDFQGGDNGNTLQQNGVE